MMSLRLGLRILGLAIALIAVQFTASSAQAHDGHAHVMQVDQQHAAAMPDMAVAAEPAELRSADKVNKAVPMNCSGCVAGCCGTGMGCSGAALNTAAHGNLVPPIRSSDLVLDLPIPARDIDPEGMRKPPRPFV